MEAWVLIAWMHAGNNSAATVPFVVDRYVSQKACKKAGEAWRGHKPTYNYRGYECIPGERPR